MSADFSSHNWRRADLKAAEHGIHADTLSHTRFESTQLELQEAIERSSMVMLLGSTGVGKTRLIKTLVRESNALVSREPSRRAALVVKAPSPHARAFSWKSLWMLVLEKLADPLPELKGDRRATAIALQTGRPAALRHATEDTLRRAVTCAARDRGLHTLYVDEAASLVKSGQGRILRDQLDVLRDLADHGDFKVVLVSTPAILEKLDASGELLRRIDEVFFRRYYRNGPTGTADYGCFRKTLKSLLKRIPERSRFKPDKDQETLLHAGSLGCVGHMSKWLRRAVVRCDTVGADCLEWNHFEATALSDKKLHDLYIHAQKDDEVISAWTEQTHCLTGRAEPVGAASEPDSREAATSASKGGSTSGRRSKRVGTPSPIRQPVA